MAEELRQRTIDGKEKPYTGFEVYNVNHYDVFRNPVQAKELVIEALEIQKLEFSTVFDGEMEGRMVKIMPVTHILLGNGKTINEITDIGLDDVAVTISATDGEATVTRGPDQWTIPVDKLRGLLAGR